MIGWGLVDFKYHDHSRLRVKCCMHDYLRPTVFILGSNLYNYLEPIAKLYIID